MSSITDLLNSEENSMFYAPRQMPGLIQAKVTETNNSKFPGKVKVEFTAYENNFNIFEWVPVLSPYAGKSHGTYLMPEIDDIVLIAFINGDPQKPFIIGSIFPDGADVIKSSQDKSNFKKVYKTKGKMDITLNDEDKKQGITVTTPKGIKIDVGDENEKIVISDKAGKNGITVDAKKSEMSIVSDKNFSIKCGSVEIKINGSAGSCEINCKSLKINAQQTAKISSNQALNVEGGMVTVKGKQTLQAEGGTMTQIKGGIVKIN